MRRQKKIKGSGRTSLFGGAKPAAMDRLVGGAIIAMMLAAAFTAGALFIERSDYFRLKSVETRSTFLDQRTIALMNSQLLNLYGGFNVFRVNLKNIADSLQRVYPDARDVYVRISLPDKLVIGMKFRKPVAVVSDGKMYPVDEEGFVLPSMDAAMLGSLPLIEGVSVKTDERRGRKPGSKNLQSALAVIKEARRHRFIADHGLTAVNAQDQKSLSFFLKNGVEVRIGNEDLAGRFAALERTLKDPRLLMDKIKYIDVRFRDVTIGPK